MKILGIETSCDETAASVIEAKNSNILVLSDIVSSQIKLHARWGGVVPNLAAREHLKQILPVIKLCFKEARTTPEKIDLIAVTNGPGLIPALLIGTNTAKTLAYVWQKPLIGIHHIEGHIYANFIQAGKKNKNVGFPVLCLVVSGGHTQLILMKRHLQYEIIGETQDDAAGEAFDKVARILNLGYPGGPAIASKAAELKSRISEFKINLPRPMLKSPDFNFSFSGLKTAVLYTVKKNPKLVKNKGFIKEICREFQQSVIDVLVQKTLKAAQKYRPKTILLAGGVSANRELRIQLGKTIKNSLKNTDYMIPEPKYSIDNSAMIATAAYYHWNSLNQKTKKDLIFNWKKIKTDANLKIK